MNNLFKRFVFNNCEVSLENDLFHTNEIKCHLSEEAFQLLANYFASRNICIILNRSEHTGIYWSDPTRDLNMSKRIKISKSIINAIKCIKLFDSMMKLNINSLA